MVSSLLFRQLEPMEKVPNDWGSGRKGFQGGYQVGQPSLKHPCTSRADCAQLPKPVTQSPPRTPLEGSRLSLHIPFDF